VTLGANNAGNAVGVFYGLHKMNEIQAGFVGGIVMAIGALTWDRPHPRQSRQRSCRSRNADRR
jgi:hypothetical protein